MRRILAFLILCLLLLPLPARAVRITNEWTMKVPTTGVTDIGINSVLSGVSDPALSGGTPFCINGQTGVTVIDLSREEYDAALILKINSIDVLDAVTPVYTDNTATFSIYWKEAMTEAGLATAERRPIFYNHDLNSAITPYPRAFLTSSAPYGKLEFESRCTAFVAAQATLYTIKAASELDIPTVLTGTTTYVINANSGVSRFDTVPEGTRVTKVRLSGSDIRYTLDGTNPVANSSPALTSSQELTINSRKLAQDFRFRSTSGGSGTTLFGTHYTR